ncbi:zinc metalloprotease [Marivirga sp. S37H4]|uniref:Zinc metalloprotease n=1 Tax=Marivirga aurantiaca TaxID=2802615 RepID=A0A935C947_9BACT|nr:zinc metalloprotease [Marivirga aurantiaca]MBK6265794.1 zinc metalloprotease [Marivirga aurantiaca]
MKRVLLAFIAMTVFFTACNNDNEIVRMQEVNVDMSDFYAYTDSQDGSNERVAGQGKHCVSMNVLNRQLDTNPGLYQKMFNIEKNARKFIAAKKPDHAGGGNGNGGGDDGGGDGGGSDPVDDGLGVINIPVYVHVIYSNSNENISDAQINSQISVLNADFNATNNDANGVPSEFAGLVADTDANFTLAGVTRKASSRTEWGTRDDMKFASKGGVDVVNPEGALNIWVCNIGGGILGYAQFPGGASSTDGVVISPQYFGTTGFVSAPFDKGRTATHEVGHYLNLRHIWGDGRCKQDDFVADTPSSDGPNYGCPSYPTVNCRSNDMTMNYMDYTNDACMYMFSTGQKERMRAIFASGGPREGFTL